MRILAATLVLLVASTAAAKNPVAAQKRKAAEEQLIAGETDAALALVEEGLAADPKDKDLLLLRGHVLLRRGEYEPAQKAYRDYLAAGATGRNKREVAKILETLDQVSSTTLVVVVRNGPAEVRLDTRTGRPFCTASPECKKGVIPGDHLVVVDKPGHVRVARRVVIEAGGSETVELTLVAKPSPFTARVSPAGALVTIDGDPAGNEIPAGEHTVVVTSAGYLRQTRTVTAAGGEPVALDVTLQRGVPVTIIPAGAQLTVDGKPVELIDGMLPLDANAREVVARAPGYNPMTVKLPADSLAIVLRPVGAFLQVEGAAQGAALFIDGKPRGTLPLAKPIEVDPGEHTVEVQSPGRPRTRRTANVPAGRQATMYLTAKRGPQVKAWISAGAMVVGLGVGTYFGTQALSKSKEYNDNAPMAGVARDDETQQALRDEGKRAARISDISFGVAGVAMIASIIFFRIEGKKAAGRIEVGAAPGGLGVSGSF